MTDRSTRQGSFGGVSSGRASRSAASQTLLTGEPTAEAMRAARRRWASGVAVVTSAEEVDGTRRMRGATVSSFSVVSLEPPLVLACLEKETATEQMLRESGVFAVSVLDLEQESLADRFAGYGPMPDPAFTGIAYSIAETGAPIVTGSSAWFDCRVQALHDGGDHVIVVGAAVAVGLGEATDDPLVNYDGGYRRIEGA